MLYIELCEVELELLADRHVNIGTIGKKESPGMCQGKFGYAN
jgi:hypothetical protein